MSETIKTPVIDKSTWGAGPWQSEPDRVDFVAEGYACLALRNPRRGFWCGYVGVPQEHPFYGRGYDGEGTGTVDVHGGLTYANKCRDFICHVPAPFMPADVWWLGFDCGHAGDVAPAVDAALRKIDEKIGQRHPFSEYYRETYRELPYVRAQIEALAAQLRKIQG